MLYAGVSFYLVFKAFTLLMFAPGFCAVWVGALFSPIFRKFRRFFKVDFYGIGIANIPKVANLANTDTDVNKAKIIRVFQ